MSDEIPRMWSMASLFELGKWSGGGTPSKTVADYWNGDIPWVSPKDMKQDVIVDSVDHITERAIKDSAAKLISSKSILFVTRSGILAHTFPVAITMVPVTVNQDIKALIPFDGIDTKYLAWLLRANERRILETCSKDGTTVNSIETGRLHALSVPVAPHNEQLRIVAKIEELFSELDKGIESLMTARAQLKIYRQALLKHAFEGKLTAQWRVDNPDKVESADALLNRIQRERAEHYQQQVAEWQVAGKQRSKPKAPKSLSPLTAEELAELNVPNEWLGAKLGLMTCSVEYGTAAKSSVAGKCPVLRMGNIKNGRFDWTDLVFTDDEAEISKYILKNGDVLFNRTNSPELVGKSAYFGTERSAVFAGYLIRINQIPTIADGRFVCYFLNSQVAKQYGNRVKTDGVNQSNINGDKLVNYPFPFCPLSEQLVIVELLDARLSEVDQLDQTISISLEKAEALRQSILKKAFSGQLVPQDPNDEPASALLARIKAEKFTQSEDKKVYK